MKYLLTILIFSALSCTNRNNITTELLNQKKVTEDSINLAHNFESYYMQQAKESMRASNDSLKWKPLIDSSTYFYMRSFELKKKLKAIEFSLDSLSRMK